MLKKTMSIEEKVKRWKIISIPLTLDYTLSDSKAKIIANDIFNQYGYKSLDFDLNCDVMIELFYNILLHEHYLGRQLLGKNVERNGLLESDFSTYMSQADKITDKILSDMEHCKKIKEQALVTLNVDLFNVRDGNYAFDHNIKDIFKMESMRVIFMLGLQVYFQNVQVHRVFVQVYIIYHAE